MALVAFAPTISRLRSLAAVDHGHMHHIDMAHGHEGAGHPPDDCWSKCGYCNFLAHAPAMGSVEYLAPLFAFGKPILSRAELAIVAARVAFAQAAQPRGPPAFA